MSNRIARAWIWSLAFRQYLTWEYGKAVIKAVSRKTVTLLWILVALVILLFVAQSFTGDLVTLEPLSVPKTFSESGYTAEVASQHLRDALNNFIEDAGSSMQGPNLALPDERPTIIVPKVGLSVDAIVSAVRGLLHYGSHRQISGEFTLRGKLVWLRLRVDGRKVYESLKGVDPESPDELLAEAAPALIEEIRPYLVASGVYDSDPVQALEKIERIIARVSSPETSRRLPESDGNVVWSYVLKGKYFGEKVQQPVKAEEALRKALKLDSRNWAAHYNLGNALSQQGKLVDAIAEYRRAIEINSNYVSAHVALGVALNQQGKLVDAIDEYHRAISINSNDALAHYNLATALKEQHNLADAIAEYRRAIEINSNFASAHVNLANVLSEQNNLADAITEYRRAIEIDPKYAFSTEQVTRTYATAHNNLGIALELQDNLADAIAEYRRAIEIDPQYEIARTNLDSALREKDKLDEHKVIKVQDCQTGAEAVGPCLERLQNVLENSTPNKSE
jgi:tetratricopeptide (TPR) repeat protein